MLSLHQRAKDVFIAALDRPVVERSRFLTEACGGDEALRHEVESLLKFHEEDTSATDDEEEPEMAPWAPGAIFAGRYRMLERLGRGGMGEVWCADDLVLHTQVALKVGRSASPEGRERLLNEVRLARQITHPAVCRVFDVGDAEGGIFYTMELVRGEDLASLVRRVGRLPSEKVVDIALQLCAGLAAAHAQGVLHRDLKPANVMIDDHGAVRITDFGIAITRTEASGRSALTGTPAYMAPEQRTFGASLSEQTDLYALGLVLYELVTGGPPVLGANGNPPASPSTLVPNVDPALDQIVIQALAADPAARPPSAHEMALTLSGDTRRTERRRTTRRTQPPSGRGSWWLAAGAVAAAVVLIALAAMFFMSPRTAPLSAQDAVVLSDFENTTGEPVFDGALKV